MGKIVPSVKNLEEGTHWEFIKFLMRKRQKMNSVPLLQKRPKTGSRGLVCTGAGFFIFRERRCAFSIDFRQIEPSVFDGAKSKVVLHGQGYA